MAPVVAWTSRSQAGRTAPAGDEEAALRGVHLDQLVPTGDQVRVGALERDRPLQKARLDPFEPRRDVGRKVIDRDRLLRAVPSVAGNRSATTIVPAATSRGPTSSRIGTPRSSQWLNL